jgi:hypothetical protein
LRRRIARPDLLDLTLGATLLFDPNGARCSLYPEEVRELLASGTVAILETEIVQANRKVLLEPIEFVPGWLEPIWSQLLPTLTYVENAYLVAIAPVTEPKNFSLLIVLGVAPNFSERAARAVATALQAHGAGLKMSIDSICYDPREGRPELLKDIDMKPTYVRSRSS